MYHLLLFIAAQLILGETARSQNENVLETNDSTAHLFSEDNEIAPGETFSVALQLSHPVDWHSYYVHSGGVELPPTISWQLPEGFTAGPIQWPVPSVKDSFFGKSYVYTGSPVFITDITAPASIAVGNPINLTAKATWQICKDSCTKSLILR